MTLVIPVLLVLALLPDAIVGTKELCVAQRRFIYKHICQHEKCIADGIVDKPTIINGPIVYSLDESINNEISPIIIWDPLSSFKDEFKDFCCPFCQLLCPKESPMAETTIWKDGSSKKRHPRTIYDTNGQVMLVSRVYRCTVNKQHTIVASHPSIMDHLRKKNVIVLFELTHQTGYTLALAEALCSCIDSGMTFRKAEELFKRSYGRSLDRNPAHRYLEDMFIQHITREEKHYQDKMCRKSAKWISADHTFKSVMNIGYSDAIDKKWQKLYNSIFIIMNEKGEVLKWRFTKTTQTGEVESLFEELAERLKSNNREIEAMYIDNCCQLRDKLQTFFKDKNLKIKLDLFHAINRFSKTISQRHPLKRRLLRDYRNVFRSYGDYGKKRRKNTPDEKTLKKNIKFFKTKWTRMRYNGKIIVNKKSIKALRNIEIHINKGCLSDIPPGAGTNRNERMHRTLRKLIKRDKLGVRLAYTLFLRAFHQINTAKDGDDELQLPAEWNESFGFPACQTNSLNLTREDTNAPVTNSYVDSQNKFTGINAGCTPNDTKNILARATLMANLYNCAVYRGFNENYKKCLPNFINYYEVAKEDPVSFTTDEHNAILYERASGMSFDVVDIQGDGNCFFAALSFQITNYIMQNAHPMVQDHLEQLGLLKYSSSNELANILRNLVVQEWLSHPERYDSAFNTNTDNANGSFEEEARRFLQNGFYSSSLGDAMPLAAANVLQMPLVILTSVVNWPLAIITPEMSLSNIPLYLAYNQDGGGHYDALTENESKIERRIVKDDEYHENASCRCGVNYKKGQPQKRFCSRESNQDVTKRKYSSRCACLKRGVQCSSKCQCKRCDNGRPNENEHIKTKRRRSIKNFFKHISLSGSRVNSLSYIKTKGERRKQRSMTDLEMFILESCLMFVAIKGNIKTVGLKKRNNELNLAQISRGD
ncbi:hypothetical protein AC249_AIPGENE5021 [Exaiptasia diaphana]|nr:hypothetical protein AC249_AIPGENE5021 [Exaiptasia diaphana]